MSSVTNQPDGSKVIDTPSWTIAWSNQTLDLTCKAGGKKHTKLCGDPHICTDGSPTMDFPSPTCSFVLTDGTFVVADAPAPAQPLNDVHVFTTDGKHFALGQATQYDDVIGTVFLQQDDGSFYGVVSRTIGPPPPNPVPHQFQDS